MIEFNERLFLLLNADNASNPLILWFATLIATFAIALLPVKLVVDWLKGSSDDRRIGLSVFGTVCLAVAINQILAVALYLPRPAEAGIGHAYLAHAVDSSFPSDHATVLFAAAFAYALAGRRLSAYSLGLVGILVGWARVYLGVHFPLDIAGAALVGFVAACVLNATMSGVGTTITDFAEALYRRVFSPLIARGWTRP